MNRNTLITVFVLVATGALAAWMLLESGTHHGQGELVHHQEQVTKGPHGGRLLMDGDFAVEITIFEAGIPPEFHVYAYEHKRPLSPDRVDLSIELQRLSGQVDRIGFMPQRDYLRGNDTVVEPHSFDVNIMATFDGQQHRWSYDNYEGRTEIPEAMAREAGIKTEIAGPITINETLTLTGRVQADPNRLSRVRARFPGVIHSIRRDLGDLVKAGDTLASVQSNESLQTYSVRAPIAGYIVKRDIQVGEATGDEPMFIIADVSNMWVELDVFSSDLASIKVGQSVEIETLDNTYRTSGVIDWISPLAAHASQSVRARVQVPNPEGVLRAGQFVRGRVTVAEHHVPLAVKQSALQRFRDFQVVFARFGETYEVRMLELGRRNSDWAEVTGGLEPGTEYVTENSYLIKADIEKSGASHDH